MKDRDRFLGMNRPITRRDFLQGVAVGLGTSQLPRGHQVGRTRSSEPTSYPPLARGLRGQDRESIPLGHRVRYDELRKLPH